MSCSQCGKQCASLKRCSRCRQVSYCGAACQKAGWKGHKKACVTLEEAVERVNAAGVANEWREVLRWEGRMDEMMEGRADVIRDAILATFVQAHAVEFRRNCSTEHALAIAGLEARRVEVLGTMQRFRDQGEALCRIADNFDVAGNKKEAEVNFQRARKVAEAHGFFNLECRSCLGIGKLAMQEGRNEEGVELLRNALAAAPLCEHDVGTHEVNVLHAFTNALFVTRALDEVEPLVSRYREAAKAESQRRGFLCFDDANSLFTSARLHEVLCTCTPLRTVLPLHFAKADSVCHRFQRARLKTHACVEPCALARHAGGRKRPRRRCALYSTFCARTRHQCRHGRVSSKRCCVTHMGTSRSSTRSWATRS